MFHRPCLRGPGQRLRAACLLLVCAAGAPLHAQPLAWSGRVGLASAWLERGLQLSEEGAAVAHAGADVYGAGGWSLGASLLVLREQDGDWGPAWSLRAGHEWPLDERWRLLLDLHYLGYERGPLYGWRGPQLGIGLADADRWSLTWNASQPRDPALVARSLDFNLHHPLGPGFGLTGGLGRVFRTPMERYSYAQAGLEWHLGRWRAQLDRTWVQAAAARSYGPQAVGRWVASVQWTF